MTITPSTDDQLMCVAAFRYCLGRQSYIVGSCLDWLRAHWAQFDRSTQFVVVRDTIEALMDGTAGSPTIDAPGWKAFGEWAWERMDQDARDSVMKAVCHKRQPWPLGPRKDTNTP